jgi:hypothetical protein
VTIQMLKDVINEESKNQLLDEERLSASTARAPALVPSCTPRQGSRVDGNWF